MILACQIVMLLRADHIHSPLAAQQPIGVLRHFA